MHPLQLTFVAALGSALLSLMPTTVLAQREPVVLSCREPKADGGEPEQFFVQLDFDEKVVRFHRRDLPSMRMLLVESWRVEFADSARSPTLLGTINRITGDVRVERVGSSGDRSPEAIRATCDRAAPVF
jgi:hypothetical protein